MCTPPNTVGSLDHDEMIITADKTYILAGYTVQCEGIVTTWEFCYQILGAPPVTFYPGIWEEITGTSGGSTTYSLIQSNAVTFDTSVGSTFQCRNYTLSVTEQFTAPTKSVVGLYSNMNVQLLHTNTDSQITTYQVTGNQSSVDVRGSSQDLNYNIAIKVHLGEHFTRIVGAIVLMCEDMYCAHLMCSCLQYHISSNKSLG